MTKKKSGGTGDASLVIRIPERVGLERHTEASPERNPFDNSRPL